MKIGKVCEVCKKGFNPKAHNAKVCGSVCRKAKAIQVYGRGSANTTIPPGTVGAVAEILISAELLLKGYAVFRALSPSCHCDLIASKGARLLRVECRSGYINQSSGNIIFPKNTNGDIDIYAVYTATTQETHYFDQDGKTKVCV